MRISLHNFHEYLAKVTTVLTEVINGVNVQNCFLFPIIEYNFSVSFFFSLMNIWRIYFYSAIRREKKYDSSHAS